MTRSASRGVSTVLDVALFLLLVGAAVGVLYALPADDASRGADGAAGAGDADAAPAVATTLATTTVDVAYEAGDAGSESSRRTDRGSVLALLARATVANATIPDAVAGSGTPAASAPDADARLLDDAATERYAAAVRAETRRALRGVAGESRVQVRATWEPLPGSGLRGETTVGPTPPPDADVHAATTTVPLGTSGRSGVAAVDWVPRSSAASPLGRLAARDFVTDPDADPDVLADDWPVEGGTSPFPVDRIAIGDVEANGNVGATGDAAPTADGASATGSASPDCRTVALVVARRTVGHLFPPERSRVALRAESGAGGHVEDRYEAVAASLGIDPAEVPRGSDVRGTNARLVAALAGALAPTACEGYADGQAAADAAAPDEVTVVVRTWSP